MAVATQNAMGWDQVHHLPRVIRDLPSSGGPGARLCQHGGLFAAPSLRTIGDVLPSSEEHTKKKNVYVYLNMYVIN